MALGFKSLTAGRINQFLTSLKWEFNNPLKVNVEFNLSSTAPIEFFGRFFCAFFTRSPALSKHTYYTHKLK